VGAVELRTNRPQRSLLELAHRDAAPAIGRPDHGCVHQLEDRPLAEGMRDAT